MWRSSPWDQLRNIEWLQGAGLAADHRGIACDGACRVFDAWGVVRDDIYAAGDVARWPHPLFDGAFLVVEHWSHAVEQAATAAHNMLASPAARRRVSPSAGVLVQSVWCQYPLGRPAHLCR